MNAHNPIQSPDAHPVDIHVGGRVRIVRKSRNLSQTDLANALGLTFQQIQKYERGANRISASKLYEIAKYLNVAVSYFFDELPGSPGGDGEEEPYDARIIEALCQRGVRQLLLDTAALPRAQVDALAMLARALTKGS